jgi:hypothetical protein
MLTLFRKLFHWLKAKKSTRIHLKYLEAFCLLTGGFCIFV